jgi:hypothetical protein
LRAGLPGGAVSRELEVSAPNGFGSVVAGPVVALAGAANATQEPRTMAALINDRLRFAIDIVTLLLNYLVKRLSDEKALSGLMVTDFTVAPRSSAT